jgi:hypothetical protein
VTGGVEWRYLAAGANVSGFSVALFILGYLTNSAMLEGIASSGLIAGVVLLVLGLTYAEPFERLYSFFSETVAGLLERLVEDSGLLDKGDIGACPRSDSVIYLIHSSPAPPCRDAAPGLLVASDGSPYIGIKISRDHVYEEGFQSLEDLLRYLAVTRYGFAKDVGVQSTENGVRVTLIGVPENIESLIGRVADPVKAVIVAATSYATRTPVSLESWRGSGGTYVFQLRLHREPVAERGGEK